MRISYSIMNIKFNRLIILILVLLTGFVVCAQQEKKVIIYVYATVTSAELQAAAFSKVFPVSIVDKESNLNAAAINDVCDWIASDFKKYQLKNYQWKKYVSSFGKYAWNRNSLEEKRREEMSIKKRNGYIISESNFQFRDSAYSNFR
jgi:hypothetical protein